MKIVKIQIKLCFTDPDTEYLKCGLSTQDLKWKFSNPEVLKSKGVGKVSKVKMGLLQIGGEGESFFPLDPPHPTPSTSTFGT